MTDAGVIPEDWEVSTVGFEFDVRLGKMLDAEKNTGVQKPYLGNRSVQWGEINVSSLSTMAMSSSDLQRFRLYSGDLLVCEGGDVGRAAIWQDQISECYYQKALHRLRPADDYDPRLMSHYLQFWSDHGQLTNYVTQTSIAHLPRDKFITIPLPVPPIKEQRAIAAALSDTDALLRELDALLAKKREIKQGAMQQLLSGKTRLPEFTDAWEETTLGDVILKFVGGGTPSRAVSEYWQGNIPWVTVKDFTTFDPYLSQETITMKGLANSATHLIPKGTLIISTRMAVGKAVRYEIDVCINQDLKALFPCADVLSEYLYYWFQYHGEDVAALGSGSTVSGVSLPDLKKLSFGLAVVAEQKEIAAILSDMDTEIAVLAEKRDKIRAVKQGMMQELLTGRTRLV